MYFTEEEASKKRCPFAGLGSTCLGSHCMRWEWGVEPTANVFKEDVAEQAARLGIRPKENQSPGYWMMSVRLAAIRALAAAPSGYVLVPKEPNESALRFYGYAPGDYASKCIRGNHIVEGLDKRATCCLSCARAAYKGFIGNFGELAAAPTEKEK